MVKSQKGFSLDAVDPERASLFGMLGTEEGSADDSQKVKDDGGSHIMREAISKIVQEAQVHKLYLMDMEEQETIDEYLRIKNGTAYNITTETPFEKVIEYTGEGEHTKEVRYKRIIEYTMLDVEKLMEALVRETKLTTIPALMGRTLLNKYFPNTCGDLKERYKKLIEKPKKVETKSTPSKKVKEKQKTKKK